MAIPFEDNWRNVLAADEDGGDAKGYIAVDPAGFGFPIIITRYQVNLNEKTHVLEAFKQKIHAYAFGRAVGQAIIEGMSLENSQNKAHSKFNSQMLAAYESKYRAFAAAKAGKLVKISGPGSGLAIAGVANGLQFQITGTQSNIIQFTLPLIIVDSTLGVG